MADTTGTHSDRRILRTRHALGVAFISLLREHDWDQIRVQDICDRANVGRSTFYNHFVDKEGLLVGGLSDLGEAIQATCGAKPDAPVFWFSRGILDHILQNEDLFGILQGKRTWEILNARFRQLAVDLARICLERKGLDPAHAEPASRFVGGGFMELLGWYLGARKRPSREEFDLLFQKFSASALDPGML